MERNIIEERLKSLLRDNQFIALKNIVDSITEDTSLINDLAMDSIQILELIVDIEREFAFSCDPDELNLDMFDRFGKLLDFIETKSKNAVA